MFWLLECSLVQSRAKMTPRVPQDGLKSRKVAFSYGFYGFSRTRGGAGTSQPEQRGTGGAFARVAASKVVEVIRVQVKTGERNRLEANAIQRKRVHANSVEGKPLQTGACFCVALRVVDSGSATLSAAKRLPQQFGAKGVP